MRVFEFDAPMYAWPRVEAVTHAEEMLMALQDKWMLALATNAEASDEADIWAALRRVGLDQYLDRVYCFRKIGFQKPSHEFFEYIMRDLEIDVSHVVMVGDSFERDVLGANQCGIRGVWFNERSDEIREGEMYRTIHDLQALPQMLDAWD